MGISKLLRKFDIKVIGKLTKEQQIILSDNVATKISNEFNYIDYGYIYTKLMKAKMYIAIIPIGYADGFSRKNRGRQIVINGKRYPLIGEINMGMIIAKVDETVKSKDLVTLIGEQIPMQEVVSYIRTSVYEGSCMFNEWIPRVLVKNDKIVEIDERKV
ncbi:MAG: hypothetical protein HFJ28_01380 [Clostridia bacterium]|nr:hypothetical protein [Clostridia bacterium]